MPHHVWEVDPQLANLPYRLLTAEQANWHEIPGVRLVGAILGTVLLVAAVRSMFGGRGR
jgi:hypothetical protein